MQKNILLVAPDNVGIIPVIVKHMQQKGLATDLLEIEQFKNQFTYKNYGHRIQNFVLKLLFKKNLKQQYFNQLVKKEINSKAAVYDAIIIIRPDFINDENLALLRGKTKNFIAYYWDSICFFPRKAAIIPFFDVVYSFDEDDCKNYKLKKLTNFYFYENKVQPAKYQVYNLTTFDDRAAYIETIGTLLKKRGVTFLFKGYTHKPIAYHNISPFNTVLNYTDMVKEIAAANCLVEVQKENQQGLTFRPFEALGLQIKLITTNPKIKEYDFYNSNNILVINKNNISIPEDFFTTPYHPVTLHIRQKYHVNHWIDTILSTATKAAV